MARSRRRLLLTVLIALAALGVLAGLAVGLYVRRGLPDVAMLEDYVPPQMTAVRAADGTPLASFGEQRRVVVPYEALPEVYRNALVAVEDAEFFQHPGLDLNGIARALVHDLRTMEFEQGGSTLTQQLAKILFLHPEKTARRKIQEALLALEIERKYSKEEIFTLYSNQMYLGHGRYGVEAASQYYFGKPVSEVTLPEAALLAGLFQRPEKASPYRHPERALARRNHVLGRMEVEGYLTAEQARAAQAAPLGLAEGRGGKAVAAYYVEEVRRWIQDRFGDEALYERGLEVTTALDMRLQAIAEEAVETGLRTLDRRRGWRRPARIPRGAAAASFEPESWDPAPEVGTVADGVVQSVEPGAAWVRVGPYRGRLGKDEIAWTGRSSPAALLRAGDLVRVRLVSARPDGVAALELEQEPLVEAALVAIEPSTGAVRALVGGYSFQRSEFDRAMQARRQTGSAFKPFVFAAALAQGWTAADRILDAPARFPDPITGVVYEPKNYGNEYQGLVTLRRALEKSANVSAVKLLLGVGYEPVISTARKLGITADLRPYPSLALGAFEISLLELTSAYGAFANQGVRVEPHLVAEVRDREGALLHREEPQVEDAVPPAVAAVMTRLMRGVITDGTGAAASALGRPLAGKTGTTDDNTDAWFVGYSPDLVVGVWVGFDVKKSLGRRETGAQAALPIWQAFMEKAYEGRPAEEFAMPPEVVTAEIDRATGLRPDPAAGCGEVLGEAFVRGTEPVASCTPSEHVRLGLPLAFQQFALSDTGELMVPAPRLLELTRQSPEIRLTDLGNQLRLVAPGGSLPIRLVEGESPTSETVRGLPAAVPVSDPATVPDGAL